MNDRPLSDAEAIMWRLQRTPGMSSTFGSISLYDRCPDLAALRRRMIAAAAAIPRLRSVIHDDDNPLNAPLWREDPDFAIEDHVRHIALPAPGRLGDLYALANQIINDPLDPHKPQWMFTVVDGVHLGSGRKPGAALVQRMHHAIADGEASIAMSMYFLDLERGAKEPLSDLLPPPEPEPAEPIAGGAAGLLRDLVNGLRIPATIAKGLREAISDPGTLASQLGDVCPAHSPLWTGRSLRRQIRALDLDFAALRDAARRHGGTLNTAFMTVVADAAARYHDELDCPVESLRMSLAVSSRGDDDSRAGNAFGLARITVPTAKMPIGERFTLIGQAASAARGGGAATVSTAAALASALPSAIVARLARQQAATVDIATSNVRAAPVPLYMAGGKMIATYPIGPLMGVPCNVTMMSYNGMLNIGINIDPAAIAEPNRFVKALQRSTKSLIGRAKR